MLLIDIPRIPPEGLDLDEGLEPDALGVEGEAEFTLRPGGRLVCHVERIDGTTVHVRGRLTGPLETACGRCLEPYAVDVAQELDLFFLPRERERSPQEEEEEVELSDRDVVVGYYEGDQLDLGAVVREQLFLALPLKRVCREDCRGLCPTCGANRNAGGCSCPEPEPPVDPRLETLRQLFPGKKSH